MNSCAICMEDGCTLPRTIDAHVDAGKILKDFPEYQNRRLVTRIATLEVQLAEAVAALDVAIYDLERIRDADWTIEQARMGARSGAHIASKALAKLRGEG